MTRKEEYLLKRRRKKIKQNELADALGCSQSLISRWEKDDCLMSEDKIEKYEEYINQK
ncbi:helix-turn-helix domain-containing protein [Halobacillus faecis]